MNKNPNSKNNKVLKFLAIVVMIYLVVFLINSNYAILAFQNFLKTFSKIIPIILFVYLFTFLANAFLEQKKINKYLGKDSGIKGWVYVTLSGILIPSPPYVVFPLLADLRKKGMKNSLIIAFLYNRNLQIAFLPVMAYYFGILFTIIVSTYIFIFAILSGIFIEKMLVN